MSLMQNKLFVLNRVYTPENFLPLVKMKTFQITSLFAIIASAMAFVPEVSKVASLDLKSASVAAAAAVPAAFVAAPAMAMDSIVEALPTNTLALEVQFGAYLAILLGTFLPCLFLVNLFIQTESRAAGKAGGQDSE